MVTLSKRGLAKVKYRMGSGIVLAWLLLVLPALAAPAISEYRIGFLADRGKEPCLQRWSPTAEYLNRHLSGVRFRVVPLSYDEIGEAAVRRQVDFLLVQPSLAVELEDRIGAVRLVTAERQRWQNQAFNVYGAVVFCRADHPTIRTLADLKDRSFMAVSPHAFCGWLTTKELLLKNQINPARDLKSLTFGGTGDAVVRAVLDGKAEAGTVVTGLLEELDAAGIIRLRDFRILHPMSYPADRFPFVCSTPLYPECPLCDLREHPDRELDKQLAMALLTMSFHDSAAKSAGIGGWSAPLSYASVEETLKYLGYGIYQDSARVTLLAVWHKYWAVVLLLALLVGVLAVFVLYAGRNAVRMRRLMADRLQELEERRQAEAEMRQIFNAAGDSMIVLNADLTVCRLNDRAVHMLRQSREQMVGKPCRNSVLCTDKCGGDHCLPLHVITTGERMVAERTLTTPDGPALCSVTAVPYCNQNGERCGVIMNYKDISDRLRVETAMARDAEQRGRIMMSNTVLHDIGNAVTGLGSMTGKLACEKNWPENANLQLLLKMVIDRRDDFVRALGADAAAGLQNFLDQLYLALEQKRGRFDDIFRRTTLLVNHIKEVLSLQRMYADTGRVALVNSSLPEIITDAVAMQYASLQKRDVTVRYDFAQHHAQVKLDKTRIIQVFINLLKNCCESFDQQSDASPHREIAIIARDAADRVIINITDNGAGCSPENARQLFTSGFTTKKTGTGIGLYQCRSIVESHGGNISFSSPGAGMGASLEIILPIVKA